MNAPTMILCALEVVTKGAAADLRVNDIPVTTIGLPGGAGRAFIPMPTFIVQGSNRIAARVTAVPGAESGPVTVEARIAVFKEGDDFFSGAGRELVRLDWTGAGGQAMLTREFQASFGPAQWAWSRCQAWADPADALANAMPFVRHLARAYFTNDTAWLESVSTAKFADMAQAFTNATEAEMKAQTATALNGEPAEDLPALPPPQPVLCCNGRLLALHDQGGQPWLRKRRPGALGAEMLLGKLDGGWQVIR